MPINLRGRSLLTLDEYTPAEIRFLLQLAAELNVAKRAGTEQQRLTRRNIALIFEKSSTGTRTGFEVAAYDQGARVTFLGPSGNHIGHKESMKDTARGLSRIYDAIEYRGFGQKIVEILGKDTGAKLTLTDGVHAAVKGTDFVYTDVWLSMGEDESRWKSRIAELTPYRVTREVMEATGNPHTKFMHCLPAFHNADTEVGTDIQRRFGIDCMECTEEVFESRASIVFDQAETRMHTIKAILVATIAG